MLELVAGAVINEGVKQVWRGAQESSKDARIRELEEKLEELEGWYEQLKGTTVNWKKFENEKKLRQQLEKENQELKEKLAEAEDAYHKWHYIGSAYIRAADPIDSARDRELILSKEFKATVYDVTRQELGIGP